MGLRYGEGYGGGGYVVSSVSKVRSSSSGGARREQGYDGESWLPLTLKERKQS